MGPNATTSPGLLAHWAGLPAPGLAQRGDERALLGWQARQAGALAGATLVIAGRHAPGGVDAKWRESGRGHVG